LRKRKKALRDPSRHWFPLAKGSRAQVDVKRKPDGGVGADVWAALENRKSFT
jgi:hypothetical protein